MLALIQFQRTPQHSQPLHRLWLQAASPDALVLTCARCVATWRMLWLMLQKSQPWQILLTKKMSDILPPSSALEVILIFNNPLGMMDLGN